MRRLLGLLFFSALILPAGLSYASDSDDAQSYLAACNKSVSTIQGMVSDTAALSGNVQSTQGTLNSLAAPFANLANILQKMNVGPGAQFISVAANIQLKIGSAGKVGTYDVSAFISACGDLKNALGQWNSLSQPDLIRALQQYVPPAAQSAIVAAAATAFPTAVAAVGAGPGAAALGIPTATPIPPPAAAPTPTPLVPAAVAATPIPVGDGGVIPGGWTSAPPPTALPTAVPVPGFPTALPTPKAQAFAPVALIAGHNDQRVWVANVHSNSVGVMDASTQRFTANVPVGSQPQALGLDDGDNTLVVANYGANSVSLVDARADLVIKDVPVAAGPSQVLVTHSGKAYILCQDGHAVAVIDLKLHLLLKSISLSSRPGHMDQPNSSGHIYVSLPDEDSVAVIDAAYDEVVATVKE